MFFYTLVAKLGVFNRENPLKWCFSALSVFDRVANDRK